MIQLHYITLFFSWLIISAMVIQGFFWATRDGQIFGWWERFFEEHHIKLVQIIGGNLVDRYIQLVTLDSSFQDTLVADTMERSLKKTGPISNLEARKIELLLSVTVTNKKDYIFLFDQEKEYRFDWWVRKMASCSICMSGWIGTLFFFDALLLFDIHPPILEGITAYSIYLASLVFVNRIISLLTDKD